MEFLCLFLVVSCTLGNNVMKGRFAKSAPRSDGDNAWYNLIACAIGAPLSLIGSDFHRAQPGTMLQALIYGLAVFIITIAVIKALSCGPMALTGLFSNFSMIIPIAFGVAVWNEKLSLFRILGTGLMLMAIIFIVNPKSDGKISKKWVFHVIVYFFSTGLMNLAQQFQTKSGRGETGMFLFWGFIFSTLFTLVYLVVCNFSSKSRMRIKYFGRESLDGLIVGTFGGIVHLATMKLLETMDSAVFFPVKDGFCIIMNAILGFLIFKERLSRRQLAGMISGLAAVIILTAL